MKVIIWLRRNMYAFMIFTLINLLFLEIKHKIALWKWATISFFSEWEKNAGIPKLQCRLLYVSLVYPGKTQY